MLFKNIKEDIQKFNNSHNSDIPNELEKIPIKEYRGNQHDLDTYLNTINYMEYIKNNISDFIFNINFFIFYSLL